MALNNVFPRMLQVTILRSAAYGFPKCSCTGRSTISLSLMRHPNFETGFISRHIHSMRRMSTTGIIKGHDQKSFAARLMEKIGIKRMKYSKSRLNVSALRLYLCTVELPEYDQIFQEMDLPDTYFSWYRITQLHIWMTFVRLSSEGQEGLFLRNNLMSFAWKDIETRMKKVGEISVTARKEAMHELSSQLKGTLYAYDEGLIGDDTVLAGALWRTFFLQSCDDPEKLANMVHYVRKQIHHLESQESSVILSSGLLTFLPLHGNEVDDKRSKPILNEIYNRT